jgi:hypothetical protein
MNQPVKSNMSFALITESTIGLLWIVWFAGCILIGVAGVFYLRTNPNASLKRQFHRWWTIGCGAGFFLLILLSLGFSLTLLFFGAAIAVIAYVNIRNTTFCDACGKATNHLWVRKIEYCARCGAKLPDRKRRL